MILGRQDWPARRVQLEALFASSFTRPIAPGYLDWRYVENGHDALLFNVEMVDATPVASYSVAPMELHADGVTQQTVLSMSTMTHPDHRGRGLFPKLATELYAYARESGIAGVWGFPNATSHPHFVGKLGWSDIYEIPTLTLDAGRVDLGRVKAGDAVRRDDDFALEYGLPSDGLIRVRRTREYLAWRYARHPVNRYRNHVLADGGRVSSFVISKQFGDGLDLVDIQCASADEARLLLTHVVGDGHENSMRKVSCWAPARHWVHGVLERMGFENGGPVTYFGARALADQAEAFPDWTDHRNWYVQMGDSDVY